MEDQEPNAGSALPLKYDATWISDSDMWFERLRSEVPWSPERVKMYGRSLELERQTCNYGEDYDYNKDAKPAVEWGGPVLELKRLLEQETGRTFTQCACNLYPDGDVGIGLHHDKRHPLLIASISFGAVRTMGFARRGQKKADPGLPQIALASGSLLLIPGAVNEDYKHTILKDATVEGTRISVTFREFPLSGAGGVGPEPTSVAAQQQPHGNVIPIRETDYSKHSDSDLHDATVAAVESYRKQIEKADTFAYRALIPALNEVIERYKQPGRGGSYRLNGCPTVKKYFSSIGLNYNTIRSWKSRAQPRLLQAVADAGTKPLPPAKRERIPQLRASDRRALLKGASILSEAVAAHKAGRADQIESLFKEAEEVITRKRLDNILAADGAEEQQDSGVAGSGLDEIIELAHQLATSVLQGNPPETLETVAQKIERLYPRLTLTVIDQHRPRAKRGPKRHRSVSRASARSA